MVQSTFACGFTGFILTDARKRNEVLEFLNGPLPLGHEEFILADTTKEDRSEALNGAADYFLWSCRKLMLFDSIKRTANFGEEVGMSTPSASRLSCTEYSCPPGALTDELFLPLILKMQEK